MILLLKWAKAAGCHDVINYICGEVGYSNPQAIEPETELAQLYRQFVEASRQLQALAPKIAETQRIVRSA